jgi:hypothetical protein
MNGLFIAKGVPELPPYKSKNRLSFKLRFTGTVSFTFHFETFMAPVEVQLQHAPSPAPAPDAVDKPVIWTVSVSRLSDLFRDITLEYDHLADRSNRSPGLRRSRAPHPRAHGDRALRRRDRGRLERRLPEGPGLGAGGVAKASGFDVMQALARARGCRRAHRRDQLPAADAGAGRIRRHLRPRHRPAHLCDRGRRARRQIDDLKAAGIEVIVGAGLITDLAEEAGLKAVFVYSAASIRQAFDDALEMARLTRLESNRAAGAAAVADTRRARRGLNDLRGESAAMEALRQTVVLYARSPATVLIQGETGSGKELVAQAIHREGPAAGREPALRGRQLRRDRRIAAGIGTVRPRGRRVHGRAPRRPCRPVRGGQRRHPVPRRDRRNAAGAADPPAARAGRARSDARGRHAARCRSTCA